MSDTLKPDMPIVAFDFETTDSDPNTAGIVQYGIAAQGTPDKPVKRTTKYVACHQSVTEGALAVHGITNQMKNEGVPVPNAIETVFKSLAWSITHGGIIVAFNMPFDWTVFVRNALDVSHRPHPHVLFQKGALYDPLTVDRTFEKYRKGSRTLDTLITAYGLDDVLPEGISHDAGRDAHAALLLAREQLGIFPDLAKVPYNMANTTMRLWHDAWAEDYEDYLRRERDPEAEIRRDWPLITPTYDEEDEFEDDSPPFTPTV